jgi:hypothetical protein
MNIYNFRALIGGMSISSNDYDVDQVYLGMKAQAEWCRGLHGLPNKSNARITVMGH